MSLHSYKISLIFLCFFFLFSQLLVDTTHSNEIPLELSSLIALKTSLNDPQNTLNTWDHTRVSEDDDNSHIWCSWSGVKCSAKTFQITSLDLSSRNLSGEIPLEVTQLSSLRHLNLSKNAFSGPFPVVLFQISGLKTLDISHNDFDSSFPRGISGLKQLTYLDCYSNDFVGPLPVDLPENRHLEYVNLGGSYFEGGIPPSYGSFKNLSFLHLAGNLLNGSIPSEIGFLPKIQHIEIGYNPFDSSIPKEIGLLSSLRHLDISNSSLFGNIPEEIGNLTMLTTLFLFKNQLNGSIPGTISKLRELTMLDLSENALSGAIPEGVSELKQLTFLSLLRNDLSGEIPNSVGFLPNLQFLLLWSNDLTGSLPAELGSGGNLQKLDVSSNKLTGPLPEGLCVGNALEKLILFDNAFTGELPRSLVNCTSLVRVRIENNKFSGSIPYGLGQLPNLVYIDLSNNNFNGNLPSDIGVGPKLENLNISMNFFEGELPAGVWNGQSLQILSASVSGITGNIPDFKGCKNLYQIELEGNKLNGSIPWDIGHCEKLVTLNLRKNFLIGIIPWEISTLPSINVVDLSYNLLSGRIPSNFDNCGTLETFNVSYNRLSGPIPSSGSIFPNLHPSSFGGNVGLCGDLLGKPCVNSSSVVGAGVVQKSEPRTKAGTAVWITAAAFSVGLFVLIAGIRCFSHRINDSNGSGNSNGNCSEVGPWKLTAFQRLNFTADDVLECLAMSDKIIGMGSAGTVYRADMPGGEVIAIKKLWGKQKETSRRRRTGVLAEVEVLGNVRHRNIVRLLGCCTNKHSTMLLYEYMPNGSLDDLLHDKNKGANLVADWITRYKIALGVAQGICYLHHDCDPVIVHRDLKPSNILLDVDMEARVADFGVAKLIQTDESMSVIAGSYGYIAPEYAYTLQVDEKSDIYSYGVLLLEILTGKRSVEPEFGDGNSIVDWVRTKIKLKNGINDILDDNAGASCLSVKEEMLLLLRVALLCTSRSPVDRPSMRDVVSMLQEAKPKRKSPGHDDGHGGRGGGGDDHVIEIGGCGGDLLVDKK